MFSCSRSVDGLVEAPCRFEGRALCKARGRDVAPAAHRYSFYRLGAECCRNECSPVRPGGYRVGRWPVESLRSVRQISTIEVFVSRATEPTESKRRIPQKNNGGSEGLPPLVHLGFYAGVAAFRLARRRIQIRTIQMNRNIGSAITMSTGSRNRINHIARFASPWSA